MKYLLDWIGTITFMPLLGLILVIFHPIQMLAIRISYATHKKVVDIMMWLINRALLFIGARVKYTYHTKDIPIGKPIILICNHCSMFDIPSIGWAFRKNHIKFISKKELSYGIPSISYNIRKGGSAIIDRKNSDQAQSAIFALTKYLKKHNRSVLIFPEGTRSKDGKLKKFKMGGTLTLLDQLPNAEVIPLVLKDYWRIESKRLKPIPFGYKLNCHILPPISRKNATNVEVIEAAVKAIRVKYAE